MAWTPITRREYLFMKAVEQGAGIFKASEAVATTAMAHPEWDLTEKKTFPEWEEPHLRLIRPEGQTS